MKTDKNQQEKHPANFTYLSETENIFDFYENKKRKDLPAEKKARLELDQLEEKGLNARDLTFYIYKNYKAFNLGSMEEDCRYDFIENLRPTMEKICRNYNPETSKLYNYLQCCISRRRQSENKKLARLSAKERMILFDSGNELYMAENYDPYRSLYTRIDEEVFSIPKNIDEKTIKHLPVLALKSSWYLTDDLIDKLCRICSLEKENFIKIVEKLNQKLEKRVLNTEKSSSQLVTIYSRQLSYQYELRNMNSEDSIYKYRLKERLNRRSKQWEKYESYKKRMRISTPIHLIAEVLNRPIDEIKNDLRYFKRHRKKFLQN